MQKILYQFVTSYFGVFVLISPLSAIAQVTQLAQNSPSPLPPINCQAEPDADIQLSLFSLEEKAQQYVYSKNKEKAAQSLSQVFQNLENLEDTSLPASLLEAIFDLEVRFTRNHVTYSGLLADTIDLYIAAGQKQQAAPVLAAALQTVQSLSSSQSYSKAKFLSAIALHHAAIGQTEQALKILDQAVQTEQLIEQTDFKSEALISIAQTYLAVGKVEQASESLAQSLQYARTIENPTATDSNPNRQVELLAKIANTYAKARQYNQAFQVLQLITNASYAKASTLSAIALQYAQQAELEQALATAQTIETDKDTAPIKANLLAEIGSYYVQAGQQEQAAQVFAQAVQTLQIVENTNDYSRLLGEVIIQYAQAGQPDAAEELVPKITDGEYFKARALAAIAISYAKAEQQAKASQAFSQTLAAIAATSDASAKSNAQREVIHNFVEAKRFDYAFQVAQAIENESTKAETLRDIALQAVDAGQIDFALQIVQAIEATSLWQRNTVLHRVALAYTQAGHYDQALQVARMQDRRTPAPAITLAEIASQTYKTGQSQRAAAIFAQALQAANAVEYVDHKIEALGAVALEYANTQQREQASQTLAQIVQITQTIEEASLPSSVLRQVAEQFALAQHYDFALQVTQTIKESYYFSSSLDSILQQLIDVGDYTKASSMINFLQTPEAKARWLIELARQYIQIGNTTQASQVLAQALQVIRAIQIPEAKAEWLIKVARQYIQTGNTSQASQVLAQALQVTRTITGAESKTIVVGGTPPQETIIDDDFDRGSLLEAIAIEYAKVSQPTQAQQVAQLLEDHSTRSQLIQRLVCYQR